MTHNTGETRIDYAARRRERAAERTRLRGRSPWILAALVVVVLVAGVAAVEAAASVGRVHVGVRVAGINVGGMSKAAATSRLRNALPQAVAPTRVTYEDESWTVKPSGVGLEFDVEGTTDRAFMVGRRGWSFASVAERLGAWGGKVDLDPLASVDPDEFGHTLDRIAEKTDDPPVDARVEIDQTMPGVVDGRDGLLLDRRLAQSRIVHAMVRGGLDTTAPVEVAVRAVTEAEAAAAADVAKRMMSGDLVITHEKSVWRFGPSRIARLIDFRRSDATSESADASTGVRPSTGAGTDVTLIAFVSASKIASQLADEIGGVGQEARDARFKTRDGRVSITPSRDGIGPDIAKLARDLTVELTDSASDRQVALETTVRKPAVTTEMAEGMGIEERISRFTTTYSSGNRPRVNNIHLLGDKLDGTLVAPGETFSFNGTVGERTAAKGYKEAGAIVNGKLVPQLGGGICQVGTTLFNTIFESGFPVVERHNHSFYISHYPKGRDATISWGGPDLKFTNDSANWVLISVSYTSSSITIALYGTDPGYEVSSATGPFTNIRAFSTEKVDDPTLLEGKKVVEDPGVTGRRCVVVRTVRKDGKVVRTDTFVSRYRPKIEVVRVGTKPKPDGSTPGTETAGGDQ